MTQRKPRTPGGRKQHSSAKGPGGLQLLFWLGVFAFSILVMVLVQKLPPAPPVGEEPKKLVPSVASPTKTSPGVPQIYEVISGENLESKIKEVDLILLQTFITQGIPTQRLKPKDVRLKTKEGEEYPHQTLAISLPANEGRLVKAITQNLKLWSDDSEIRKAKEHGGKWEIVIAGVPTHLLILSTDDFGSDLTPTVPLTGSGKLAIIIDDLGESLRQAEVLAELDYSVTFSVLPMSSHTSEVVALARRHGKVLMLHLPMEPIGYPVTANPGPGALFIGMMPQEMRSIVARNLELVPGAVGVNNHMGSKFTQDVASMRIILHELKSRGLFFLDSMTAPTTVTSALAKDIEIPYLQRSIFIDNVQDTALIVHQLHKAERLALSQGNAVAIGHPYPETLKALRQWQQIRNNRVNMVAVTEMLPAGTVIAGQ